MKSLSGRNIFFLAFLSAIVIFTVSACSATGRETDESILYMLAQEGELAIVCYQDLQPAVFELTAVGVQDLVQTREIPVSVSFPYVYHVHFEIEDRRDGSISRTAWFYGRFYGPPLHQGQRVSAGDFLGEVFFETPDSLAIERDYLLIGRNDFEAGFERERDRRLENKANAREELRQAEPENRELMRLRLTQQELEYERFLRDSQQRRMDFDTRLERLEEPIRGKRLYAPIDGVITWVNPGINDTETDLFRYRAQHSGGPGRRVVTITDDSQIIFTIDTFLYILRFGNVLTVHSVQDEIDFNMRVVSDPMVRPVARDGFFEFRLIPDCMDEFYNILNEHDLTVFELGGMLLRAHSVLPLALDAVVVHRRAIVEEGRRSYVLLYEDGAISKRYVLVGSALENYVQILAGLDPGQLVVVQ